MKQGITERASALVVVIGCAALLAALPQAVAHSQGITAQATVKPSDPARDIVTLRQQVLALEKRVAELEKEELEKFKGDDVAEDAAAKKLEQRLAKLEKAQETPKSDDKARNKPEPADDDQPMTVRAPFVVQDDSGKTIFRVDIAPDDNRARIMVGNPIGARAEIGPNTNGATVGLYDSSNTWRAALIGRSDESHVELRNPGKGIGVRLSANATGGDLTLSNAAAVAVASLTTGKGGSGNFTLGNSGGTPIVEAGMLGGIGIVRTGPGGFGPAGVTGGVMPASSIQGRK